MVFVSDIQPNLKNQRILRIVNGKYLGIFAVFTGSNARTFNKKGVVTALMYWKILTVISGKNHKNRLKNSFLFLFRSALTDFFLVWSIGSQTTTLWNITTLWCSLPKIEDWLSLPRFFIFKARTPTWKLKNTSSLFEVYAACSRSILAFSREEFSSLSFSNIRANINLFTEYLNLPDPCLASVLLVKGKMSPTLTHSKPYLLDHDELINPVKIIKS